MKKITEQQSDELWGETGPYSQAQLIIEERILDDSVSRVFVIVSFNINPFTFKYIKKHRKQFSNHDFIQALLNGADYQGEKHGYCCYCFQSEYVDEEVVKKAKKVLKMTREAIILMHKFVMQKLGLKVEKQSANNIINFKNLH